MRYLITTILLALAPLSWAEDVYYCIEGHNIELAPTESGDAYQLNRYKTDKFTFKYLADTSRLAVKGIRVWGGDEDELYYLDCQYCDASPGIFYASDQNMLFKFSDGRFTFAASYSTTVDATAGTCTEF